MDGIKLLLKAPFEKIKHLGWQQGRLIVEGEIVNESHVLRYKVPSAETRTYNHKTQELFWSGSLQKLTKHNNYSGFTYREFKESVGTLADLLDCKPVDLAVINAEISATVHHPAIHSQLLAFNNKAFLPMVNDKGTSKIYGAECKLEQYGAKIYDKTTAEYLNPYCTDRYLPSDLTQTEFLIRDKRFYKRNGFNLSAPPTLADLLKPEVYRNSFNLLIDMTKQIQFNAQVDWAYVVKKHDLSPSEFGKMMIMNDPDAAACLKEHSPEVYKKCVKLYRSVKHDLSPAAATVPKQFQQAVEDTVQLKFDF